MAMKGAILVNFSIVSVGAMWLTLSPLQALLYVCILAKIQVLAEF